LNITDQAVGLLLDCMDRLVMHSGVVLFGRRTIWLKIWYEAWMGDMKSWPGGQEYMVKR